MWYISAKLLLLAIVASAAGIKALQQARRRSVSRKRMLLGKASLEDTELVTISGTVQLIGEPLLAPLSGTRCVAHQTRARGTTVTSSFTPLLRVRVLDDGIVKSEMVPFTLATEQGDVLIDGSRADLAIRPRSIVPRDLAREQEFLRTIYLQLPPGDVTFDEVVVEPGAKIKVHGIAVVEAIPGDAMFRETPTRTRLVGDDAHPITISEG